MRALAPLLVGALLAPGADTQAGCGTGPQQPNVFRLGSLFHGTVYDKDCPFLNPKGPYIDRDDLDGQWGAWFWAYRTV